MKRNRFSLLTPVLFFGFLGVVLVCALVRPKESFSYSEGRALAQWPKNDLTDLPALTQKYSDYIDDHFPFREELLALDSAVKISTNQRLIRDITIDYQKDGVYLLPKVYPVDPNERLTIVYELSDQVDALPQTDFVYAILPQKNNLLGSETVDARISEVNRQGFWEDLCKINTLTVLDIGDALTSRYSPRECRDFYYRTDFHWNHRGAFRAAEQIALGMQEAGLLDGVTLPTEGDFLWQELGETQTYLGDLNRQFSYQFSTQEDIPFYCLADIADLHYFLSGDAPTDRSAFLATGLDQPALQYNLLSTENLGYYRVTNPHARSNRRVLIFKDSLENPMTDYFTALFSELIVVDLRSYKEPYTLSELIETYELDTVILMFHQNHLSHELSEFLGK